MAIAMAALCYGTIMEHFAHIATHSYTNLYKVSVLDNLSPSFPTGLQGQKICVFP
jgi:hypothetical protein